MQYSGTATFTGHYFNFYILADAALGMAANILQGKRLSDKPRHDILHLLATVRLPRRGRATADLAGGAD